MTSTTPDSFSAEALANCTTSELVRLLIRNEDRVPRHAINECARRGEEILDELAGVLQKEYYWGDDLTTGEWWLRLHAVMILGLMIDERAGDLLVHYMRRIDEARDASLCDWLSGYWPALFGNKPPAVVFSLRTLAEDRSRDAYVRTDAADSVIAYAQATSELDDTLAWAARIAFDESEDFETRLLIAADLIDFPRPEYRAALEALADSQTKSNRMFNRDEIEQAYSGIGVEPEWERFTDPWVFYTPEEIAKRQERWAEEAMREEEEALAAEREEPYVRAEPKIGRNDPCPCGSGKKYKKCCMP
jgi:hypothetical protein